MRSKLLSLFKPPVQTVRYYYSILTCSLLTFLLFPASAVAQTAVLTVIKSQENANQWAGITRRLQVAGVAYCVIELPAVSRAADLGNTKVLFLPNVEMVTPAQAIALEEWMSQGGRVIASGPVGGLSQAGVRQLLRSLLGAYWGFSLSSPSKLQPLQTKTQEWVRQKELNGTVRGGVIIPAGITSKPAAIWQSRDNPPAVVTTERSTFLGWRWGVDAASSVDLDSAWLRAALGRHAPVTPGSGTSNSSSCPAPIAQNVSNPKPEAATLVENTPISEGSRRVEEQAGRRVEEQSGRRAQQAGRRAQQAGRRAEASKDTNAPPLPRSSVPPLPRVPVVAVAPAPVPVPKIAPQQSDEPLDRLAPPGLDVAPTSQKPIANVEAIALVQELQNLIGRFESTLLAANAINSKTQPNRGEATEVVSANTDSSPLGLPEPAAQALSQAREIAKTLPQLINRNEYAAARQQWLKAQQLLFNHYPTDRNLAQPEIRAMWLDRGTIVRAGSEQGLAKIFDRMAAAGINTVFLETVNAGYPIYPSSIAPKSNPLVRGWDPLASGVKLAHERGMELHAWVWAFAVGNRRHNALLNLPTDYPGPVLSAHPDWASYDNRGSLFPIGQGKPFLDPANPEARQYLLSLFDEIVSRYQVDGLQLDYIRYPFQDPGAERTYGYGKAARQQFQQLTGVDPTKIHPRDRVLWQKWTDFRTQQIDSFVASVSQQLRQKRPDLIMSAAVFPLSEQERIQKLQQDWELWARRGDIDLVVPMTYALDTYRFQRLAQPWLANGRGALSASMRTRKVSIGASEPGLASAGESLPFLGSTLILPGIRLLNLPLSVAVDQIQLLRDLPVSGYSLFAVENLSNELQKIFQRTQGTFLGGKPQEPIPYRQPFQAAAVRYAALQREWNFLLANQQLWLREPARSAWRTQSQVLETALNQLAQDPSPARLAVAKASLISFESQFSDWMRLQSLNHPYQVKVWKNRLATLEGLLRYGEQVVLKRKAASTKADFQSFLNSLTWYNR